MNRQTGISKTEEMGKVDTGTLRPTELRVFEARIVDIKAEKMTVSVSGREKPETGNHLRAENNRNPKMLEINITSGDVLQNSEDSDIIIVPSGTIIISGEKTFSELQDFQKKEGDLPQLPVRDPDLVQVDGRTFRQVGSLQLIVVNAKITLAKK